MVTLRPGSLTHRLLHILSVAGEFPARSLRLLGSVRSLELLVHRLESVQQCRTEAGTELGSCKMLCVSGRRERRTIRLYKSALPLLNELHRDALGQYLALTGGHRFSSSVGHVERNHRVAETLAMCQGAGIEFCPYMLPALQKERIDQMLIKHPGFYIARSLKRLDTSEMNKTIFTRLTGALFTESTCFAVYNTRSSVMKWSGMGEFKTAQHLTELARMNSGIARVDRALLLGESMDVALQTLLDSDRSPRMDMRFDRIYPHIHFVPLDQQGIRLLNLLSCPNWNEQILGALFPEQWRSEAPGVIEYDARNEDTYILSHLDGDIARIIRVKQALELKRLPVEVVCFPWQTPFLHRYLGALVQFREISMDDLEEAIFM